MSRMCSSSRRCAGMSWRWTTRSPMNRTVKCARRCVWWWRTRSRRCWSSRPLEVSIPAGQTVDVTLRQPWANPPLWSHVDPHLLTLRTTLDSGDQLRTRFGFREFWVEGDKFYLERRADQLAGHVLVAATRRHGSRGDPQGLGIGQADGLRGLSHAHAAVAGAPLRCGRRSRVVDDRRRRRLER